MTGGALYVLFLRSPPNPLKPPSESLSSTSVATLDLPVAGLAAPLLEEGSGASSGGCEARADPARVLLSTTGGATAAVVFFVMTLAFKARLERLELVGRVREGSSSAVTSSSDSLTTSRFERADLAGAEGTGAGSGEPEGSRVGARSISMSSSSRSAVADGCDWEGLRERRTLSPTLGGSAICVVSSYTQIGRGNNSPTSP